jgi:hypothetical protein
MQQLVPMFYVVYHHYRPMLDITTQIRRYSRREKKKEREKENRVDEKRTRKKRVEVRENLGIIGCVERTKATVDNVASSSATSISRFSFFEKYIYI